jgi:hypothetical protein
MGYCGTILILQSPHVEPNIVSSIKSRRMGREGHVTRMGEGRGVYRVLVGRPKERDHWKDLGVSGGITLK